MTRVSKPHSRREITGCASRAAEKRRANCWSELSLMMFLQEFLQILPCAEGSHLHIGLAPAGGLRHFADRPLLDLAEGENQLLVGAQLPQCPGEEFPSPPRGDG